MRIVSSDIVTLTDTDACVLLDCHNTTEGSGPLRHSCVQCTLQVPLSTFPACKVSVCLIRDRSCIVLKIQELQEYFPSFNLALEFGPWTKDMCLDKDDLWAERKSH